MFGILFFGCTRHSLSTYKGVHVIFRDVEEQVAIVRFVWDHKKQFEIERLNCREGQEYFWSDRVSCAFEL